MRHLKRIFEINSSYLERSNEVKEILSNYGIQYSLRDMEPFLKITFPYAHGKHEDYVEQEYNLILSFLQQLIRYDFEYEVDEQTDHTIVTVRCS